MTSNLFLRVYQFKHHAASIYGNPHQSSYKEISLLSSAQLRSSKKLCPFLINRYRNYFDGGTSDSLQTGRLRYYRGA